MQPLAGAGAKTSEATATLMAAAAYICSRGPLNRALMPSKATESMALLEDERTKTATSAAPLSRRGASFGQHSSLSHSPITVAASSATSLARLFAHPFNPISSF